MNDDIILGVIIQKIKQIVEEKGGVEVGEKTNLESEPRGEVRRI